MSPCCSPLTSSRICAGHIFVIVLALCWTVGCTSVHSSALRWGYPGLTKQLKAPSMQLHGATANETSSFPAIDPGWEDDYKPWRVRMPVPFVKWEARYATVKPSRPVPAELWANMPSEMKQASFQDCVSRQAKTVSESVLGYASPDLFQLRKHVKALLAKRGMKAAVTTFWGRSRYVRLMWPYVERNLEVNGGVIGEVLLVTNYQSSNDSQGPAQALLEAALAKYPGVVHAVPRCAEMYGCVYTEVLNRTDRVYVKLDDDIVFVMDGSFEHLVYQSLTNKEYIMFSGSVVNNPQSYGVHKFVGAPPPTTFHYRDTGVRNVPPLYNHAAAADTYWGLNTYDITGGQAHESFIYNVAHGRLDAYAFHLWNLNQCRCAGGQPGQGFCGQQGHARWSINAIAWQYLTAQAHAAATASRDQRWGPEATLRNLPNGVAYFDEPLVTRFWADYVKPHRAAIVGDTLFVHLLFTRQRNSHPDFGLKEEVMLPWYELLMHAYTASEFGMWKGNASLFTTYERMQLAIGQVRFDPN